MWSVHLHDLGHLPRDTFGKANRSERSRGMMGAVGTRDANRNPRRWVDESRRVRVVEGWHPSRPSRIGYNVLVDDDWLGTFETLDDAAAAATTRARFRGLRIQDGNVVLSLVPDPSGPRGRPAQANLHPVRDPDAETED